MAVLSEVFQVVRLIEGRHHGLAVFYIHTGLGRHAQPDLGRGGDIQIL